MKVRTIINAQLEFIDEISEDDYKLFSKEKNKGKLAMAEVIQRGLKTDKILVKSYRFEKENESEN